MRAAIVIAIPMLFAVAFGLFAVEHATRSLEVRLAERQAHARALDDEVARLEVERATLAAPPRIEALARAQGLGPASTASTMATPSTASTMATPSVAVEVPATAFGGRRRIADAITSAD